MPVNTSDEVSRNVAASQPPLPAVAATKDRALKAVAVPYFQKPINSKSFLDTVQRALGQISVVQGG